MRELERQLHAAKLMCSELRASQSAAEHRADSARERANVLQRLLDDSKFRESKLLQQIGPAQVHINTICKLYSYSYRLDSFLRFVLVLYPYLIAFYSVLFDNLNSDVLLIILGCFG